jgi:hypothetical protein
MEESHMKWKVELLNADDAAIKVFMVEAESQEGAETTIAEYKSGAAKIRYTPLQPALLNEGEQMTKPITEMTVEEIRSRIAGMFSHLDEEKQMECIQLWNRAIELRVEEYTNLLHTMADALTHIDNKAEACHESHHHLVECVDEYFDNELLPVLECLYERLDESESETLSAEFMVQGLASLLNVSPDDLLAAARSARQNALSRNGGDWGQGVPDSNHAKNLASVGKKRGPRNPVNTPGDRDGYVKESTDPYHDALMEAAERHIAKVSPIRRLR